MRRSLPFVLLLSAVGLAEAQWLEKTVSIPNAGVEFGAFARILHNPINNHVYVTGGEGSGLQVLDGSTRSRLYGVDSVGCHSDAVLCLNRNRLYVTCSHVLVIVNTENDSTLGVQRLPGQIRAVYNPVLHKAYVVSDAEPVLRVFDVGPDTLLRQVELVDAAGRITRDSASNRVFLRSEDSTEYGITVIDCDGDTIVGHVATGRTRYGDMMLEPSGRQLYVHGDNPGTGLPEIWVYDVDSLKPLDTIHVPGVPRDEGKFCLNRQARLLYFWRHYRPTLEANEDLILIDCATNTIRKRITLSKGPQCVVFNEQNGKLYVGVDDTIVILAVPDSITARVAACEWAYAVGWGPPNGDVYVSGVGTILVLSGEGDTVISRINCPPMNVRSLVWTAAGNRMYASGGYGVTVIGPNNTVVKQIAPVDVPWEWRMPAYAAELNQLYVSTYYGITRYDCNTDSIAAVSAPRHPSDPPFLVPGFHKLYVPAEESLTLVYDLYADSVIRILGDLQSHFLYNPRNGLVYGFDVKPRTWPDFPDSIRVIDPQHDSVLTTLEWGRWTRTVLNTADNELYCTADRAEPSHLLVCDAATNAVVDTIEVPGPVFDLAWYAPLNKLYAISDTVAYVFDCRTRTPSGSIELRSHSGSIPSTFVNERNEKLWICSGAGVDVVQCSADSVVASFDVRSDRGPAWNALDNRVYTSNGVQVFVFRDDPVDIEARTPKPPARLTVGVMSSPARGAVDFVCAVPGPQPGHLLVIDLLGREVWGRTVEAGAETRVTWRRADARGRAAPAGVYFVRLESGNDLATAKVVAR